MPLRIPGEADIRAAAKQHSARQARLFALWDDYEQNVSKPPPNLSV